MELKELTEKTLVLFNSKNTTELIKKLPSYWNDNDAKTKFKELVGDLSIVTLTNSKTFKIEVKKWDKIPAIVVMFAQMWKQLMITCNNEENRYLMELKDIMLERYFG